MKNLTLKSKQKISQTEVLHLYRWFTHTHTKQRERKQEVKKAEQTSTTAKKHVIWNIELSSKKGKKIRLTPL